MPCLSNNWTDFLLPYERARELAKSLCLQIENIQEQNECLAMEGEETFNILHITYIIYFTHTYTYIYL